MFAQRVDETTLQHVLRLFARTAGLVGLAIILLFFLSGDIEFRTLSATDWIGFAFFPVGTLIGLVLAWNEEFIGGAVTLVSVAGFYLLYGWLLNSSVWQGWVILPFLIPAVLFLIYGFVSTSSERQSAR